MEASDPPATIDLDHAESLPPKNRRSYVALIAVQALNGFNDNFVKILLVAFAGVVAKGTDLGTSMQLYMGAIFSLPYVLFAPVTGWMSDRFSKQRVILWMQIIQVIIFGLFHLVLMVQQVQFSLWASLGCFFLLATQAAFFSPAKLGVVKELVGSRRLGSASGTLQLTNFLGILGGMGLAGWWFGSTLSTWSDKVKELEPMAATAVEAYGSAVASLNSQAWVSVNYLVGVVSVIALLQIVGAMLIHRTPDHPQLKFYRGLWVEHLTHLRLLFAQRPLKLAALGITYFWFMSNAVGGILITLSHELHPGDASAASKAMSMMPAMLGVGIMIGSLVAGAVCRKRIELGLVPISGFGLALSLLWSGLAPVPPWVHVALVAVGAAGGAFMTPLYAFVQDRSRPEERARIMSAINLMDCVGGIVANLVLVKGMQALGWSAPLQLLVLVPMTLAAAIFITKLLSRSFLTLVATWIIRTFYRIQVHHEVRMPKTGPLLILPNHVSYADALMLGVSTPRDVRFVMLDTFYKMKSIHWALKLFGSVPISPGKAKEAVRTVADALKHDAAVVLYPEGQLSRTGFLNEVRKGYELMARMGNAPVQPVWVDGLWGSIFSFEGGRFFKKVPRALPYRISVWFGAPIPAREATSGRVREVLTELSAEAFLSRANVARVPTLKLPSGAVLGEVEARMAYLNALRILETSLITEKDALLCLLPETHPMAYTFAIAVPAVRGTKVHWSEAEASGADSGSRMIVISDATHPYTHGRENTLVIRVSPHSQAEAFPDGTFPALYDPASGALLTLSVTDPPMPAGEEDHQRGVLSQAYGHPLPGVAVRHLEDRLQLAGFTRMEEEITLYGYTLTEPGMVVVKPSSGNGT